MWCARMKSFHLTLAVVLLAGAAAGLPAAVRSQDRSSIAPAPAGNLSGVHDFDFEIGEWRVHHRIKRPVDTGYWLEFDGTCTTRKLMDGAANVEDHVFHKPGGITRGIALRTYDSKTGQWAIWWVDSRNPHGALDPPVVGRFDNGVGTFYSDDILDGKQIRTRFIWAYITPTSARWEQAYSSDAGKTWETNWIMEFQRTS
jgi:hypothetical protein